ncbi:hypothetical protein [Streptomyces sp. NPDC088762]|uniref:hypothetical protein n=1 Tax=Streptomyces sp. NPDC088762 TaxID=3365891 RepID=UPI00382FE2D0
MSYAPPCAGRGLAFAGALALTLAAFGLAFALAFGFEEVRLWGFDGAYGRPGPAR